MTTEAEGRTQVGGPAMSTPPAPAATPRADAAALLARAGTERGPGAERITRRARLAERVVAALLGRVRHEQITLYEHARGRNARTFGCVGELHAEIVVHDHRAYLAVLREGSIGLGRGYLEGWWSSPDPVTVVRVLIRNLGAMDEVRNRIRRLGGPLADRVRAVLPRHTRSRNREDIAAHYDIGTAFFELFLDETMTYSSAVFAAPDEPLADASRRKYDLVLDKLGVHAGHHILEIGSGWGGFAIRAVEATGARVTTTTISGEQLSEARRRVLAAGHADRVEVLGCDWRDLRGSFDAIVSIEMIEAVDWRDYDRFFRTIERCLRPDGVVGIQAICVPDQRWDRAKNTEDFVKRFVFPNGFLPSLGAITRAVSGTTKLQLLHVEDLGAHYAETLSRWRERFDQQLDAISALGLDDRFCRLWRFYLAYCEAGFHERHCTVYQLVLAGPEWRGSSPGGKASCALSNVVGGR